MRDARSLLCALFGGDDFFLTASLQPVYIITFIIGSSIIILIVIGSVVFLDISKVVSGVPMYRPVRSP